MKKKKNRNLLYALPIAEVDEKKTTEHVCRVTGRSIDKIDLAAAAEYKGCIEALWELRKITPYKINDEIVSPATFVVYGSKISEPLSFAFRHAHGIQRFNITEIGKKNKPNTDYVFSITDVEFYEDYFVFFGLAKNKNTKEEKEYLVYFFIDQLEFFLSDIEVRRLQKQVFFGDSDMERKRLRTICMYAYKYLKKADEVRLSKQTEFLTSLQIAKPGKQMFVALHKELQKDNIELERKEVIINTLETAFHRYVQSSREKLQTDLCVHDGKERFYLGGMENFRPCKDKKGLRFDGLKLYNETPWENYRINVEYDYKKNTFTQYDEQWQEIITVLTWDETEENNSIIKNFRRCVNSYFHAKTAK